jgi:thiamine pyrophosphokinase
MGGRMDMTVANILLIAHANLISCRIEIWHGDQTGWVIKPPGEDIPGQPGDILSLIPLGGQAVGVTITGFKYPLRDDTLIPGTPWGISNIIEKPGARVQFSEGLLLVVHTPAGYR